MPKQYKKATMKAKKLMVDDYFKLGGLLYRITRIKTNKFNEKVIRFYQVGGNERHNHILIIEKNTLMRAYNQV